jgi:hypothetical protein
MVRRPNRTRALSRPIRVLNPPARMQISILGELVRFGLAVATAINEATIAGSSSLHTADFQSALLYEWCRSARQGRSLIL